MPDRHAARRRRVALLLTWFGWDGPPRTAAGPALVLLSGLPGTGKSFVARALGERYDMAVVRSDEVRKALFPAPRYSPAESGVVYTTCYGLIEALLARGYAVVFDATNLSRSSRRRAAGIAVRAGAPYLLIVTTTPPDVVAARLRARAAGESEAFSSDAGWQVYREMTGSQDRVAEPAVFVDTSAGIEPALIAVDRMLHAAHAGRGARRDAEQAGTPGALSKDVA